MRRAVHGSIAVLLAAGSGLCGQDAAPPRLAAALEVSSPPLVDGKLADACWADLAALDRFSCVITKSGRPVAQTRARAGHDAKHLYIGAWCTEPRMKEALAIAGGGDAYSESVEVFVDGNHDRHTYHQFRVSITGATEHRRGQALAEASWRAAVGREEHGWTVEMAIPWSLLTVKPAPGAVMGFNLDRIRMNTAPAEFICWAPTPEGFHAPAKFGDLVLGSYDGWLGRHARERVAGIRGRTLDMIKRFPASTRGLRDRAAEWSPQTGAIAAPTGSIRTETDALAALAALKKELQRAEETYRAVRLAVIEGEFR